MVQLSDPFKVIRFIKQGAYYSLPALGLHGFPRLKRLPICIRMILESLLRNCDEKIVKQKDVIQLAEWNPIKPFEGDVPFIVSRVILQDFTGVPLLVDLAAMRDAVKKLGRDPQLVEPQVPVDLVVDHSVQVDRARTKDAFQFNLEVEFERNHERYLFLKWGQQAFKTFQVVPPAIGIVHQVNLEHIATVVNKAHEGKEPLLYLDTLVGTDSHTTMINGLGLVGWGVGGIEAEAAMLGQPVSLQTPEVIGVHISGKLHQNATATDLTLFVTELLRKEGVVGKFVEFFGEGAATLTVADRATIGNMAPEYGATIGYFPPDDKTLKYLEMTGRDPEQVALVRDYLVAQELFGIPKKGEIDYTKVISLNLSDIVPSVAGPKRPQDRIPLPQIKDKFNELLIKTSSEGGYGKADDRHPHVCVHSSGFFPILPLESGGKEEIDDSKKSRKTWSEDEMVLNRPFTKVIATPGYSESIGCDVILTHGTIVIAAITSCTNTSNPYVMIAAGLLAKKAVMKGLRVNPMVKTSLAPGSRIVTDYLEKAGLQKYLDALGFELVGYGCTTCIGNSGPLDERVEEAIKSHDLITASVLSGNRNFEARIHGSVKANFLMSPPLVVAFAIAGRANVNLDEEPVGFNQEGLPVYLHEIWPDVAEIEETMQAITPDMFKKRYSQILADNPVWQKITTSTGSQYQWDANNTYIQHPPYFADFSLQNPEKPVLQKMTALALFGDSVTTDHISPAGAFKPNSSAGQYLMSLGISPEDFNSYGSRRGNHHVMVRGTFANVRLRNKMVDEEGGITKLIPENQRMTIFDACEIYEQRKVPLIVFAGKDYGMGSSRDWAAKGAALLGIKVVVAKSFERIHRSNLIGMGILPLQFLDGEGWEELGIHGDESFSLLDAESEFAPQKPVKLMIESKEGEKREINLICRLDSPLEIDYYTHGGILPYVLRQLLTTNP